MLSIEQETEADLLSLLRGFRSDTNFAELQDYQEQIAVRLVSMGAPSEVAERYARDDRVEQRWLAIRPAPTEKPQAAPQAPETARTPRSVPVAILLNLIAVGLISLLMGLVGFATGARPSDFPLWPFALVLLVLFVGFTVALAMGLLAVQGNKLLGVPLMLANVAMLAISMALFTEDGEGTILAISDRVESTTGYDPANHLFALTDVADWLRSSGGTSFVGSTIGEPVGALRPSQTLPDLRDLSTARTPRPSRDDQARFDAFLR